MPGNGPEETEKPPASDETDNGPEANGEPTADAEPDNDDPPAANHSEPLADNDGGDSPDDTYDASDRDAASQQPYDEAAATLDTAGARYRRAAQDLADQIDAGDIGDAVAEAEDALRAARHGVPGVPMGGDRAVLPIALATQLAALTYNRAAEAYLSTGKRDDALVCLQKADVVTGGAGDRGLPFRDRATRLRLRAAVMRNIATYHASVGKLHGAARAIERGLACTAAACTAKGGGRGT
jgi:tetratricopeptide (TPR) repeat protein